MLALRAVSNGRLMGIATRCLRTTSIRLGDDGRDKRQGHIELSDRVAGEIGPTPVKSSSYSLINENLLDTVINNTKFKDIPIVYIRCTRNNTKVTLARRTNDIICIKSAGTEGFKHCRKGTTVAGQAVARRVLMIAQDNQISQIRMVFDGLGPGRDAAYKVFELSDLNIVSFSDRTQAAEPWNLRPRHEKRI